MTRYLLDREQVLAEIDDPQLRIKLGGLPLIRPRVVANITGGVLQGASSDYPTEIYALDFEVDSFDDDAEGIEIEGSNAYVTGVAAQVDADFVQLVIDAEPINFSTGEPVDADI
jgi:hypothetical protein